MKQKKSYGIYKHEMEEPQFVNSPLYLPRIQFGPRKRVMVQVAISFIFMYALYFALYHGTPSILKGTQWSLKTLPDSVEIPGWALLLIPMVAIIPGVYTFLFLKYNFNY